MIKTSRKKCKMTQKELAKRCNLSQSFLSKIENENVKTNITIRQIIKISKHLNISPYSLAKWIIDKELNCNKNKHHKS